MTPLAASPATRAISTRAELYRGSSDEWDTFVRATLGGTFFHLHAWRAVLEEAFGFRPHFLAARRGQSLVGVLPLCETRSALRHPRLLSLPFTVQGGICALDEAAQRALEQAAIALGAQLGAASLELRDGLESPGFAVREGEFFRFRRPVLATDEENLAVMHRKQRRMVRVGQQSGLLARVDVSDLETFYDLFVHSMRRLGTPVFARRYFRLLLSHFGDDCILLTVRHQGTPVAASLSFLFGDTVLPYYAGSRRDYFRYAVNDFMYWELMRYARTRGARVCDFGRSRTGTGAYQFKRHWGCTPEPLRYRVHQREGTGARRHASEAVLPLLRAAWQHLPLALTRLLGPTLVRHLGVYYT